jgi:endoglucanase
MIEAKFYKLWLQIAEKLACKSSMVSFESINEPPVDTQAQADEINKLNEIFLQALNETGGFNTQRVVTLVGPSMDPTKTSQWFKPPTHVANPWALQFHYYSPYDFIFGAWGKTIWGSDADKQAMRTDLSIVRGNFTDVPLVIGEYSASSTNTEPAARWKYYDYMSQVATELGAALMVWDNGLDNFDRTARKWRDPTSMQIIAAAIAGKKNSLPDSTTDAGATTQSSSAYIFKKIGDAVTAQSLPWLFNGNTVVSIKTSAGTSLSSSDYSTSGSAITFSSAFLSKYFNNSAGTKESLTLAFSAGASVEVQIVEWDTPVFGSTSSTATAGQAISIPVTWKGVQMVAAVKILESDGTYLFDDWTQWLPSLQQARGVSSCWHFYRYPFPSTQGANEELLM